MSKDGDERVNTVSGENENVKPFIKRTVHDNVFTPHGI